MSTHNKCIDGPVNKIIVLITSARRGSQTHMHTVLIEPSLLVYTNTGNRGRLISKVRSLSLLDVSERVFKGDFCINAISTEILCADPYVEIRKYSAVPL